MAGEQARQSGDRLLRLLLAGGAVRGALLRGTDLVRALRAAHGLGVLETLVLGHACLAALLMAASLKGEEERISLQVDCSGPIRGLVAEANGRGEVRGYLKQVPIPVNAPLESFDLSPFFGAGFLSVIRQAGEGSHPFTGQVMLEHGNLALDLSNYFLLSEQIPTAMTLSVQFDRQGEVTGAGGLLLQAMPGAEPELMTELEQRLNSFPSLGGFFASDGEAPALLAEQLGRFAPEILGEAEASFRCRCGRERMERLLLTLPVEDLDELRSCGPFPLAIRCHFCSTIHSFEKAELEALWRERQALAATPDRQP
ncbi:MAG: Hsp33 family molecular chaperone HslO [Thermodesulfobacteriota bacterium]